MITQKILKINKFTMYSVINSILYCLGKPKEGKYFLGFSDDGSYCSNFLTEKSMLRCLNSKYSSDSLACDIYFTDPHLSFWMD